MRENPIEMDDLGVPLFQETPKSSTQLEVGHQIGEFGFFLG